MPRILLLITDLEIGGTPAVVRELSTRLHASGVDVQVACLAARGPVAGQIESGGVAVTALGAGSALDWAVVSRLVKLIRRERIDTVLSFLVHANAVAAAASRFVSGVRWLQSIQTTQPYPRWHWLAQAAASLAAEKIIVPSESVAGAARKWAFVADEKMSVIPNAVDVAELAGVRATRSDRSVGRAVAVGFIGRLDPIKRVGDLISAVGLLTAGVHLHIFGEGSERVRIQSQIAAMGLQDRVTLHGAIGRPQEALRQIDVLVLPSSAEGFGLVLIEAMAGRVPVIATDAPGIRDVVRRGETGLLVPVGAPAELAGAIRRVVSDSALRDRLVMAGFEDVLARFSWDSVLPRYRQLLLGEASNPGGLS